jgi:hypothetical protein
VLHSRVCGIYKYYTMSTQIMNRANEIGLGLDANI